MPASSGTSADGLQAVLDKIAEAAPSHLTEPVPEADLARFEKKLGCVLPPALRGFLLAAGHGLFYGRHEILGPQVLLVHDIEFVPGMPGVAKRLGLPRNLLPFHRAGEVVHVVDLDPARYGEVSVVGGEARWPDVVAFLQAMVIPG